MPQTTFQIPSDALKLDVLRYSDNGHSTQSLNFVAGEFFCYGLEDEHRELGLARNQTRIELMCVADNIKRGRSIQQASYG